MSRSSNHQTRRRFVLQSLSAAGVLALGDLAGCGVYPAREPPKVRRIGYLSGCSAGSNTAAFQQGLRELGYVEGQNIAIDYRLAEGRTERLPDLAAELVGLQLELIVAVPTLAARAVRDATANTPIVMIGGDPVETGLVASLARPGGNVTGLSSVVSQLAAKRLQLLSEAVPGLSRVAVLWDADGPGPALAFRETGAAGQKLGVHVQSIDVRAPSPDFRGAFEAAARERADAVISIRNPLITSHQQDILDLAASYRLPTISSEREFVLAGGLLAYGPDTAEQYRRAATYVDKILKGANPADLPVEQPTILEFVINLKTAQALGLTIPQSVLLQATEVIQ